MGDPRATRRTYFWELWRAGAAGVIETAGSTFLLLIAVRWFAAGAFAKGLVAGAGSLGLLISPLVVNWTTGAGWPVGQAASRILAMGAAGFFLGAAMPGFLPGYVFFSVIGMAASAAVIPLLTQMYQDNYPKKERGRRFSRALMIRIGGAALFSKLAGQWLGDDIKEFPYGLLLVFGGALAFASFCLSRCPTRPIADDGAAHPLRALHFVRDDALFRRTLICWMLMGFANLMMLPLRVEVLANPKYEQSASVGMIVLLTAVLPNLARFVMSPIWGHLFDQMNFFALRVTLNLGFAIGILTFFTSHTLTGMVAGALVYGVSNAGGDVAWSLWVTKFAPPGRVADYMAVHTFLTGVRGVAAPLLAFYMVNHFSLGILIGMSTVLMVAATSLLLPELKFGRKTPPASPLVAEGPD